MKYRNLSKNSDGTYNIVWFGAKNSIPFNFIEYNCPALELGNIHQTTQYFEITDIFMGNIENKRVIKVKNINYTGFEGYNPSDNIIKWGLYEKHSDNSYEVLKEYYPGIEEDQLLEIGDEFNYIKPSADCIGIYIKLDFINVVYIPGTDIYITITFERYSQNAGTTIWYNENNKHDNYSSGVEGISYSLIQRLGVIKNELWYNINYGLPLIDKVKNKATMDAYIISVITNHAEIEQLVKYTSRIEGKGEYHFEFVAKTTSGELLELSDIILL